MNAPARTITLFFLIIVLAQATVALPLGLQTRPSINFLDNTSTEAEEHVISTVKVPTILPGTPLYFFKRLNEELYLSLSNSTEEKEELRELYAQERLQELQELKKRGDFTRAEKTRRLYEEQLRTLSPEKTALLRTLEQRQEKKETKEERNIREHQETRVRITTRANTTVRVGNSTPENTTQEPTTPQSRREDRVTSARNNRRNTQPSLPLSPPASTETITTITSTNTETITTPVVTIG